MSASMAFQVYRLPAPQLQQALPLLVDLHDMAADARMDGSLPSSDVASPTAQRAQRVLLTHPTDAAGLSSLALLPATGTVLYLGETFSAHITLANQSVVPLASVALKIELTTERGGGATVLADSGTTPIPALLPGARHDVRISHDVKELGAHTLACSAVFTAPDGERKYHVQFVKWLSANPLHVRTKLRALPLGSCCADAASSVLAASSSADSSAAASSSGPHRGVLLLEVGIENSMQVPLLLPAVRFLVSPGVVAEQVTAEAAGVAAAACAEAAGTSSSRGRGAEATGAGGATGVSKLVNDKQESAEAWVDDTRAQPDVPRPGFSGRQQEQQQQQQQQQQSGPPVSVAAYRASLHALGADGGSRHFLWRVHLEAQPADTPRSVSASTALGRLEVHWRSLGGQCGRLQTQSILGLPLATAGRDVRLALHGLPAMAVLEMPFEVQLRVTRRPSTAEEPHSLQQQQQQQQQQPQLPQQQRDGLGLMSIVHTDAAADAASSSSESCGVVVQGSRSVLVGEVPPGGSACVTLTLVALRGGVQRVPTFVVVSGDGRPLDTVHDLHLLVAAN